MNARSRRWMVRAGGALLVTLVVAAASAQRENALAANQAAVGTRTALTVGILGPSTHQPGESCQFQATVSGGTPPYSYSWFAAGQNGFDEFFYPNSTGITSSYVVSLSVTDALGNSGSASQTVYVGWQYQPCPE